MDRDHLYDSFFQHAAGGLKRLRICYRRRSLISRQWRLCARLWRCLLFGPLVNRSRTEVKSQRGCTGTRWNIRSGHIARLVSMMLAMSLVCFKETVDMIGGCSGRVNVAGLFSSRTSRHVLLENWEKGWRLSRAVSVSRRCSTSGERLRVQRSR